MPPRRARVAETPKSKSNELAWLPAELWPIVLGEVLKARPMVSSAFDGYWWTKSQDAEKIGKRWGAEAGALMVAIAINDPVNLQAFMEASKKHMSGRWRQLVIDELHKLPTFKAIVEEISMSKEAIQAMPCKVNATAF